MRDLDGLVLQSQGLRTGHRRVQVADSAEPHKPARTTLRQLVLLHPPRDHLAHRPVRLPFYPGYALGRMQVQVCLGQQMLELGVLRLQLAQPSRLRHVHAAELGASLVERGIREAALAADLRHRHAGLGLSEEPDDLFL